MTGVIHQNEPLPDATPDSDREEESWAGMQRAKREARLLELEQDGPDE